MIRELGAENIPCIRVYNKSDLAFAFQRDKEGDAVSVSAKTGEGLGRLLSAIDKKLDKGTKRVTLHLPYDKAGALDSLYREAKVESVEYGETVDVVAVCTPRIIGQLKDDRRRGPVPGDPRPGRDPGGQLCRPGGIGSEAPQDQRKLCGAPGLSRRHPHGGGQRGGGSGSTGLAGLADKELSCPGRRFGQSP